MFREKFSKKQGIALFFFWRKERKSSLAARPGAQPTGLMQFAEAAAVSQRNRRKPLTPVRASTLESLTKNAYIKNPNENNLVRIFGGR